VLEKHIILLASDWDMIPLCLISDTILAPTGYPDTALMENENAPAPDTLNRKPNQRF